MATETPIRPDLRADLPEPRDPFAPRPPVGPAVRLRRLIGVNEELLYRVPEERSRYTWYGAIVLNTAVLAAGSMALALGTVRDDLPGVVVLGAAAMWFWVILALDSWLVSSTHGISGKSPLRVLLPRLVLSVLLGLFIAEPLLFQIFDKEIRKEIAVSNEREVAAYRGRLVSCNPADGRDTTGRAECAEFQLKVPGSPGAVQALMERNAARTKTLKAQVDRINKTLNGKMATEQRECARDKWIWRGGFADVTQTCERAREDSSSYRRTSKLDTYEGELSDLVEQSSTLADREDTAVDAYQSALQKTIDDKTTNRAADLDKDGILTRAHALSTVAWSDAYAGFVALLLHALLLAVDAMPVLAKLMSGSTTYDTLLTARFANGRRMHADELQVQRGCAAVEHEVRRHHIQQDAADRMNRLEHRYGLEQAERAVRFRTELNARAARILRGDST